MIQFPLHDAGAPPPPPPSRRTRRRRGRTHRRRALWAIPLVPLVLLAGLALRLSAGLPRTWTDRIGDALSTPEISIEPEDVSFSLARLRLSIGTLGVYERGVVRRPLVRARGLAASFRPRGWKPSPGWVRSLSASDLEVNLDFLADPEEEESPEEDDGAAVELPDVPPVSFSCARVSVLGLSPRDVSATLSVTGGLFRVDGISLSFSGDVPAGQRMEGSFFLRPEPLEIGSDGKGWLTPNVIAPLLRILDEPSIAEELEKFAFPREPPAVEATYRYAPGRDERQLRLDLRGGEATYNDVAVSAFSGVVSVGTTGTWSYVSIDPLQVFRPEGSASGRIEVIPGEDRLECRADATMDPLRLLGLVGLVPADFSLPVAFPVPAQMRATGSVSIGDAATNALQLAAFVPSLSAGGVTFERVLAEGILAGSSFRVPRLRADVLGGRLDGSFAVGLPSGGPEPADNLPVDIRLDLADLSHEEWSGLFGEKAEGSKGQLDLSLVLHGPFEDIAALSFVDSQGTVDASVRDSRLFRVPLFAGLADIISSVLPGVDLLADVDSLSAHGDLANGRLRIDPFKIDGTAVGVSGKGNVFFPSLEVDLKVQAHLLNRSTWLGEGVYWLLSPLSKIFEIRATGSISSPRWTSATFQANPAAGR